MDQIDSPTPSRRHPGELPSHGDRDGQGDSDALWVPLKQSGSLTERIVERIGNLIETESLRSGERLPSEREMARLLGVSRPALREAVKTLEAHGRLVVRHGQGVFVGPGNVGPGSNDAMRSRLASLEVSLAELFAMRSVLEEPAAAWAAAAATQEQLEGLEEALRAEEEARQPPIDFARLGQLDAAFHLRIVQMANNRFLSQTLGILHEMLDAGMETTLTVPGRVERSRQDHRALFEAVRAREPERARQAAAAHIQGAREAAMARVRSDAGFSGGD